MTTSLSPNPPEIDDGPPDRATALGAAIAIVLGALVVVLCGWLAVVLRSPFHGVPAALVAVVCVVCAVRARRDGDRGATIGAAVVGGAAVIAPLAAAFERTIADVRDSPLRDLGLGLPGWPVVAVIALVVPALVGARALAAPWHGLLRPPRPALRSIGLAATAGVLTFPVLAILEVLGALLSVRLSGRDPSLDSNWLRSLLSSQIFPRLIGGYSPLAIGFTLALLLPSMELLLHSVGRRAFAGSAPLIYIVSTALAFTLTLPAPLLPSLFLYVGALVTGAFARETESVVPGIVFWQSLALGGWLWHAVVP